MLLHPLNLFPTIVAAYIEMENNGSFEKWNMDMMQKRGQILYSKGKFWQLPVISIEYYTINILNSIFFIKFINSIKSIRFEIWKI